MGQPGYVYVLTNPSMPGLVKIGRTIDCPNKRAKQLRGTGVPEDFELYFAIYVEDCEDVEMLAHERLDNRRVESGREFFRVLPDVARQEVVNAMLSPDDVIVGAEVDEFASLFIHFLRQATGAEESFIPLLDCVSHLSEDALKDAYKGFKWTMKWRAEARREATCPTA